MSLETWNKQQSQLEYYIHEAVTTLGNFVEHELIIFFAVRSKWDAIDDLSNATNDESDA